MADFEKILSSFSIKDELNPKIWTDPNNPSETKMIEEIRLNLINIADAFIDFLGYDIFIQDITMTGSLANYNWSDYSDIDLHIMYDYKESGSEEELFKDLFKLKKTLFNSTHNITVKGFEVELYVQDVNEPHYSTGVYSVLYDEWIEEPEQENVKIDTNIIKSKVEQWEDMIDNIIEDSKDGDDDSLDMVENLKEKIKRYRQSGLEKDGEYSYENLTFKFLRRNGYIQKLFDFQNELLDKKLSLSQ